MSRRGPWRDTPRRVTLAAAVLAAGLLATLLPGCMFFVERTDTTRVRLDRYYLTVEVADSAAEQARGLSGRPEPSDTEGMLFVWEDAAPRSFTISSVPYDLDVIFIGEDGTINEILPLSPDGPRKAEGSQPSRYVVEVRGGWAERFGVEVGHRFDLKAGP